MRRLLGMAWLGSVALSLCTALLPSAARDAQADPEATGAAPTPGSLTRYRDRLESEASQVFETAVTDPLRRPLAAKGVALWATDSVAAWSRMVVAAAPSLAGVVESLGQRSRVLWQEERVIDAYDSLILQLATVHSLQKGLFRVVDGLPRTVTPSPATAAPSRPAPAMYAPPPVTSVPAPAFAPPAPAAPEFPGALPEPRTSAPNAVSGPARLSSPAPTTPPAPTLDPSLAYAMTAPAPRPTSAVARPVASPPPPMTRAPMPREGAAPAPTDTRPPTPKVEAKASGGFKPSGRGPVWPPTLNAPPALRDYQGALDREAYRILSPEIEGGMQDALAARKSAMRAAPTVAAWRAELTAASPSLGKAGAVLERRTEVLRGETRVVDTMESEAVQHAAVGGLQAGLERILAQFGR